jgi:hypothetical protein
VGFLILKEGQKCFYCEVARRVLEHKKEEVTQDAENCIMRMFVA